MSTLTGYPSKDKIHLSGIPEEFLNPKLMPVSMLAAFLKVNEGHLNEVAIEHLGHIWSKNDVHLDAFVAIKAFMALGVKPKERIVIISPNNYQQIIVALAANAIGIQVAYLDYESTIDDLVSGILSHNAKAAFIFNCNYEEASKIRTMATCLKYIINIEPYDDTHKISYDDYMTYTVFTKFGENISDLDMIGMFRKYSSNDDVTLFIQTSGTTARPKTLPFTNREIFGALTLASNSTGTKTRDASVNKVLCILPCRFPYGWMPLFVNLIGGNHIVLASGAKPEDIGEYYKYKPSYVYGTPTIFQTFMEKTPKNADISSIVAFFCAGTSMPKEKILEGQEFLKERGCSAEIRNNYGIGELLCVGTASDGVPYRENTSGKFYVGIKTLIVDEKMREVKYGETGELLVASPTMCRGYYNDHVLTSESFLTRFDENGKPEVYFKTGDFVSLSTDGYVTFCGRKKRIYQPRGANNKVNCQTIEEAILSDLNVKACAVIICKDADGYDISRAFVSLKDKTLDATSMPKQIFRTIISKLLDYQLPYSITIIDEIPLLKSGKTDYNSLEKMTK